MPRFLWRVSMLCMYNANAVHLSESRTKRPVDKKALGQKGPRTKRPGDGKACLFDAPKTRRRDWADSNVECLLEF